MDASEIKILIDKEVKNQLKIEKQNIAKKIRGKLLYTGEFARSRWLIDIFDEWSKDI